MFCAKDAMPERRSANSSENLFIVVLLSLLPMAHGQWLASPKVQNLVPFDKAGHRLLAIVMIVVFYNTPSKNRGANAQQPARAIVS